MKCWYFLKKKLENKPVSAVEKLSLEAKSSLIVTG